MNFYIILDDEGNIIGLHASSNFETKLADTVNISQDDFNLLQLNKYTYKYVDAQIINTGKKPEVEIPISIEEQKIVEIADNVSLLIELQADLIGGAI